MHAAVPEFHGLDAEVMLTALRKMEKSGKVSLISGSASDEVGVKFHDV